MEKKLVYFFPEPTSLPFIHKLLVFIFIAIENFSPKFFGLCFSVVHEEEHHHHHHHHHHQQKAKESNAATTTLERGDLGFILWRMGLAQRPDEVEMNEEEAVSLPDLFADEEPSLQELRQAFSVFDQNGDGFIDELELRRVLRALGVGEGLQEVGACKRMIQAHDRDGDGRINIVEFVRLMELGF